MGTCKDSLFPPQGGKSDAQALGELLELGEDALRKDVRPGGGAAAELLAGRALPFQNLEARRQYPIPRAARRSCLQPVSVETICSSPWGSCSPWGAGGDGGEALPMLRPSPKGPRGTAAREELPCPRKYLFFCLGYFLFVGFGGEVSVFSLAS